MRIVPHFAAVSYSLAPGMPLLTAPQIAGLLPTGVPPLAQIEITREPSLNRDSLRQLIGAFRSRDQLDSEIAELAQAGLDSLRRKMVIQ
jgi:hypothetical protein